MLPYFWLDIDFFFHLHLGSQHGHVILSHNSIPSTRIQLPQGLKNQQKYQKSVPLMSKYENVTKVQFFSKKFENWLL